MDHRRLQSSPGEPLKRRLSHLSFCTLLATGVMGAGAGCMSGDVTPDDEEVVSAEDAVSPSHEEVQILQQAKAKANSAKLPSAGQIAKIPDPALRASVSSLVAAVEALGAASSVAEMQAAASSVVIANQAALEATQRYLDKTKGGHGGSAPLDAARSEPRLPRSALPEFQTCLNSITFVNVFCVASSPPALVVFCGIDFADNLGKCLIALLI